MTPESEITTGFHNRRILLCVTGGIAAYKSCILVRKIIQSGGQVRVIMTRAAHRFVTTLTLATLSGNPVADELFPQPPPGAPQHLELADWGEMLVVAPATANFIGKLANGIADDLAASVAMAFDREVVLAPAMNHRMWLNPAVQRNVETLRNRGFHIIGPETGAMGGVNETSGTGRMSEPEDILAGMENILKTKDRWSNLRVLITSGPTREPIDPVRYIGNRSSGRMGDAIAIAAAKWGADVTLIRGSGAHGSPPGGMKVIVVDEAAQMATAVKARFDDCDLLVMTAAVADWSVANPSKGKLKKKSGPPQIEWKASEDILAWAGKNKQKQVVVGFALETDKHLEGALDKLERKGVDAIVLNDPTRDHSRFGGGTTQLTVVRKDTAVVELQVLEKSSAAGKLLGIVEPLVLAE